MTRLPTSLRCSGVRLNVLTHEIISSGLRVHSHLGPGLLESAYRVCLVHDLRMRGLSVAERVVVPIAYDGLHVERAYEADIIVESRVIVEVKAVTKIHPVHLTQLLSYLRLSELTLGLLMNFHEVRLKDGIRRIVNRYREE